VLFAILLIVIYLTRQQVLGWIRWDGWALYF
jgi:hypothetical protein